MKLSRSSSLIVKLFKLCVVLRYYNYFKLNIIKFLQTT